MHNTSRPRVYQDFAGRKNFKDEQLHPADDFIFWKSYSMPGEAERLKALFDKVAENYVGDYRDLIELIKEFGAEMAADEAYSQGEG